MLARTVPILLLALLFAGFPPVAAETSTTPKVTGSYAVERGVRVLRLWGTPKERGFAQGYLLGDVIIEGMQDELSDLLRDREDFYETIRGPLMRTGFRFSKSETAELTGMLAGIRARVPAAKRKIEVLSREPDLTDLKVLNTYGDWSSLGCSSAALWGERTPTGKAVIVRNFDYTAMDVLVSHQHVRIVAPAPGTKEKGWIGVSHPGSVGALTAFSEDGVFVAIHDVPVTPRAGDYLQGNVPRLLAIKRLAAELGAKGAVEAAAEKCRSWNTLYGNNIMVATRDPGGGLPAGVLEYDSRESKEKGVALRGAGKKVGDPLPYVVCTNHYRQRGTGRCARYRALEKGCEAAVAGKKPDLAWFFALANRAAEPEPERTIGRGGFGTLHQVVADTGERTFHVRMVAPSGNIRDAKTASFDVRKVVAGTKAR